MIAGAKYGHTNLIATDWRALKEKPDVAVNRLGFGHIAFVVDDVPSAREAVLAAARADTACSRRPRVQASGAAAAEARRQADISSEERTVGKFLTAVKRGIEAMGEG